AAKPKAKASAKPRAKAPAAAKPKATATRRKAAAPRTFEPTEAAEAAGGGGRARGRREARGREAAQDASPVHVSAPQAGLLGRSGDRRDGLPGHLGARAGT